MDRADVHGPRLSPGRVVIGPGPGLGPAVTDLRPPLTRPHDYVNFWTATLDELDREDPDPVTGRPADDASIVLCTVVFRSLGGARISGYLLQHGDDAARPLVIHAHGYNSECAVRHDVAAAGCHVLGFDVRGFGRSRAAVPDPSPHGWIATGLESPATSVLRGAVCDYVRAVEVARSLLPGRPVTRIIAHGVSFAGGLAVLAQGHRPSADLLAVGVPTFGWFRGRRRLRPGGSAAELNAYLDACSPGTRRAAEDALHYFDAVNAAGLVRAPAVVGVGRVDHVVPPETVYPVVNHLATAPEVWELPVSHSDAPEEAEWARFDRRWLELAVG